METKLLQGEERDHGLGIEALISIASRQYRREFFYRSLMRCALLTLLFVAFGCFFAIYNEEKGVTFASYQNVLPFQLRQMLKDLFRLSLVPTLCFAVCFSFGGRLCRLCDTVFPAIYGTAAGAYFYTELSPLFSSFSALQAVRAAPYICCVLAVITVYSLFCPVCASFGECRRRKSAVSSDSASCFTYYLSSLTALALSVVLRDAAAVFL